MSAEEITTESDMRNAHERGTDPAGGLTVYASPETIELPGYDDLKFCRRCEGVCNREHVAVEDCRVQRQCIAHVYCAWCEIGWESLMIVRAMRWEHYHTLMHTGHGVRFFLSRLEALTCIVA